MPRINASTIPPMPTLGAYPGGSYPNVGMAAPKAHGMSVTMKPLRTPHATAPGRDVHGRMLPAPKVNVKSVVATGPKSSRVTAAKIVGPTPGQNRQAAKAPSQFKANMPLQTQVLKGPTPFGV